MKSGAANFWDKDDWILSQGNYDAEDIISFEEFCKLIETRNNGRFHPLDPNAPSLEDHVNNQ